MHHLAQINVARFIRDKDDPANADFMAALDEVNARADEAAGFIWRLVGDGNDATSIEAVAGDPRLIVNMSVWADIESLRAFSYRQRDHVAVMRRRREWFETMDTPLALWWVSAGHEPTVAEGMARLAMLKATGPTPDAFTFGRTFPPATDPPSTTSGAEASATTAGAGHHAGGGGDV
jgi:hypothetical protein